jgi:hypothetical protein
MKESVPGSGPMVGQASDLTGTNVNNNNTSHFPFDISFIDR